MEFLALNQEFIKTIMKKIVLLSLVFWFTIAALGQRSQDSLALMALYNATNGPNWTNNTNWLSSEPISKWYGITLTNNRVTKIDLLYNNLSGLIPVEIGNLTNLVYLWLNKNQLSGSIPPEIGNLTNLTEQILSDNLLSGNIPPEIGNLTNLTGLGLSNNWLSGNIPIEIGNLTNLNTLDLSNNGFTGSIPKELLI